LTDEQDVEFMDSRNIDAFLMTYRSFATPQLVSPILYATTIDKLALDTDFTIRATHESVLASHSFLKPSSNDLAVLAEGIRLQHRYSNMQK
jgi:hypothetical protein